MGFDIQIKKKKQLVIPDDAGYVPPNPAMKGYIRLSGKQMSLVTSFMEAVGMIEGNLMTRKVSAGKIPAYKFCFNDGQHSKREEAAKIAEKLTVQDIFSTQFMLAHFKKLTEVPSEEATKVVRELMGLWIAFNKVAAANDGYMIR